MEELFTVKQVSLILQVHQLTVRRYIRQRKLNAIKIGGNVRIRESDFSNFQKSYSRNYQKLINVKVDESKNFTFDEPLLRLRGIAGGLSIPQNEI